MSARSTPSLPDRFELRSTLGQGGMATVYLAQDSVVRGLVALKILHPHLRQDELVVERFRREIAAVRRIGHENVVAIHDLVETDELLCLVLEYHPGNDLKRVIRRGGALPAEQVLAIAGQVLDGLGAAHLQGVVHRDVKPHNLLVSEDGTCKIADFGLARVDDLVGVTTHTMTLGTPEYLAPELLSSPIVDGRADLYALGVSLYEALSGKLPYRASSPMALLKMHQDAEVPDLRQLDPSLPDALCAAVKRAMAKDPDDRFTTAAEMRAALTSSALARLHPSIDRAACRACGARLIAGVASCVECGHEPVQFRSLKRGGRCVFIPRLTSWFRYDLSRSDDLTFQQKHDLVEKLQAVGGAVALEGADLDKRLRFLPLVVGVHLPDDDATQLTRVLEIAGVPARRGFTGLLGRAQLFWKTWRPFASFGWAAASAFLGSMTMMLLGEFVPALQPSAGLALILAYLVVPAATFVLHSLWDSTRRGRPLARYSGVTGQRSAPDALIQRVTATMRDLTSPRLRALVKRLAGRALELRREVEQRPELRAALGEEVTKVLEASLVAARRSDLLERELTTMDSAEIYEQLRVLDERIDEAQDAERTGQLIEDKLALKAQLGLLDEQQREQVLLQSKLLDASARLSALRSEIDADAAGGAPSVDSISVVLRELSAELEAHREIDGAASEDGE